MSKLRSLQYLKLTSGEDLISEIEIDEKNEVITLVNPFRVFHLYAEGSLVPQFHPLIYGQYFLTAQINADSLMLVVDPGEPLAMLYRDFLKQLASEGCPRGITLH